MLNICATVTFPALPDSTYDLVIVSKSYSSALLDAAADGDDVNLDDIANEIFSKNARNIIASFKATLRAFGIDPTGEFYIGTTGDTDDRGSIR